MDFQILTRRMLELLYLRFLPDDWPNTLPTHYRRASIAYIARGDGLFLKLSDKYLRCTHRLKSISEALPTKGLKTRSRGCVLSFPRNHCI